ncbi:hypothetical protein HMPREF1624_04456 [Sporothrix schenckii ATCC 58251]|uniref:Peptidyl-tRNA hydrolase n=1 Tax=Sporothrix schenckii (strain ATCC 58251 / de Perez 2211183) TaxID=1391915 RepID=U7PUF1_SPOS1|nr:hypothetical protein HMPREF1624_04456 [Sporothrix schenckii ATCC 58251]
MRFSTKSALMALPLLGAAAEDGGLFGQYRAQFQNLLGSLGVGAPEAATGDSASSGPATGGAAPATGSSSTTPTELTLSNWESTLYSTVKPDATVPEEWRILITGRNKTCFGHCAIIESAFYAATVKTSAATSAHAGIINCDDQPVLCNSWSSSPGYLYIFELLPKPAKTDIYVKRLNFTTSTPETYVNLYEDKARTNFHQIDGYFHPLDGQLAELGLAVPIGYVLWFFNAVPSWMFMIAVSFISRTFMGRRAPGAGRPGAGPAGAAAPAAAR